MSSGLLAQLRRRLDKAGVVYHISQECDMSVFDVDGYTFADEDQDIVGVYELAVCEATKNGKPYLALFDVSTWTEYGGTVVDFSLRAGGVTDDVPAVVATLLGEQVRQRLENEFYLEQEVQDYERF